MHTRFNIAAAAGSVAPSTFTVSQHLTLSYGNALRALDANHFALVSSVHAAASSSQTASSLATPTPARRTQMRDDFDKLMEHARELKQLQGQRAEVQLHAVI